MCENHSEINAVIISLSLLVASELLGMSKYKENSIITLVIHTLMKVFPYESIMERRQRREWRKHRYSQTAELYLQSQQGAEPDYLYREPMIQFDGIYSFAELSELPIEDLASIARSLGKGEMADRGNRDELIAFLVSYKG
jgi:hypothetical protein